MDLGLAIRILRNGQGMTQGRLASMCGVSTTAVCYWETGRRWPPKGTTELVCRALGVPTAYLMLASIEKKDFPEEKRALCGVLLDQLRGVLAETASPEAEEGTEAGR